MPINSAIILWHFIFLTNRLPIPWLLSVCATAQVMNLGLICHCHKLFFLIAICSKMILKIATIPRIINVPQH